MALIDPKQAGVQALHFQKEFNELVLKRYKEAEARFGPVVAAAMLGACYHILCDDLQEHVQHHGLTLAVKQTMPVVIQAMQEEEARRRIQQFKPTKAPARA